MGARERRGSEKKAVAALEHELKWAGKDAAAKVLRARFGEQMEKPEADDRTIFWLHVYSLAERGRPHTHGIPLPLPPLDIIALVRELELPAGAAESVAVVSAMDDAWIKWKDSKQSKPSRKARR